MSGEGDHFLAQILEWVSEFETYIPGVRTWVGEILIGKIPLTDEVTVYELADLWADVQNSLDTLACDAQDTMAPLLDSWTGDTAMSFSLYWENYLEGLVSASENAAQIQQGVQGFGLQIETMKFMAVIGLAMMVWTIWTLVAAAWGTLGISAVGIIPTIKATGVALAQVARNIIESISSITIESLAEAAAAVFRLSPKQIVARALVEPIVAAADHFVPDEIINILMKEAPEAGELMDPAIAEFKNLMRKALVQAQLRAWEDTGAELATTGADDLLGQWASRQIGEDTFAKAMWMYLKPRIWQGIEFMGGGNLLAQMWEAAGGERKGVDLGELAQSTAQGAVFGAAMWGSPFGHVVGSTAASAAFALVGDALAGGVHPDGTPVDWLGDALHAGVQGFEAGVVFGIHSALPEMHVDPVMPEGGKLVAYGELDGVMTLGIRGEGVQIVARPDAVAVTDEASGAKLLVRSDGTFVRQDEPGAPEGFGGPVVEADPPGTTYQRPTSEPVAQEPEVVPETETPGVGTSKPGAVVEAESGAEASAKAESSPVEPSTKPEPASKPEPGTKPESGTRSAPGAKSEPTEKSESSVEPQPGAKPNPGTKPEQSLEPESKPVVESEPEAVPASSGKPPIDLSKVTSQANVPDIRAQAEPLKIVNQADVPSGEHQPLTGMLDPETIAHLEKVLPDLEGPGHHSPPVLDIKSEGPMVSFGPKAGATRGHVVIPTEPNEPAQIIEIGAGVGDSWLGLMSDHGQTGPDPDRAIPDPSVVELTRTDKYAINRIKLDALQKIPDEFRGKHGAVVINNNRGYKIEVAIVGEALRDGGVLIVQGRTKLPGQGASNPDFREFYKAMLREQSNPGSELPPGYRLVDISTWETHPVQSPIPDISIGPRPPEVMGTDFHSTDTTRPLGWPNARIVIERVDLPHSPPEARHALIDHHYTPVEATDIQAAYGDRGLAAAAALARSGMPKPEVLAIVQQAHEADVALRDYVTAAIKDGLIGPVHIDLDRESFTELLIRAFDSGNIVNAEPQKVSELARNFVGQENGQAKVLDLEKYSELRRAVDFATQGKHVGLGGVEKLSIEIGGVQGDLTPGKADVIVYDSHTGGEAIQHITPPTDSAKQAIEVHLKDAIEQIKGEHNEVPPEGFKKTVEIEIQNPKNALYSVDRDGFLVEIAKLDLVKTTGDQLTINGEPITVRVFNGHGTFDLGPGDFGAGENLIAQAGAVRSLERPTAEQVEKVATQIDDFLKNPTGEPLSEQHIKTLQQAAGALHTLRGEFEAGRRPDPFVRDLVDRALTNVRGVLTDRLIVPEHDGPPSPPHDVTSQAKPPNIVNQLQSFDHEDVPGFTHSDMERHIQQIMEIEAAKKKIAEADQIFQAEQARINAQALADETRAQEAIQKALEQGKANLPAKQAALDASNARLQRMRLHEFGEAEVPTPSQLDAELQPQLAQLHQLRLQHAESAQVLSALKDAGDALTFMKQLADAYQAKLDSARQLWEQYDATAATEPYRGLIYNTEMRLRQMELNRLLEEATRMAQEAQDLRALVENLLGQGSTPDAALADLFSDFGDKSQQAAMTAIQDAQRVRQHFTDNDLTPLLEDDSHHLTKVWTEQHDALAQQVRRLRAQQIDLENHPERPGTPAKLAQVTGDLDTAERALRAKELALRGQWLKDPESLRSQRDAMHRQISDLGIAITEAWRHGDLATATVIGDDANRAQDTLTWIEHQLGQLAPKAKATDFTAVQQALDATPPAFQQRYTDLTSEAWRTHLGDQLSEKGLQDTWNTWEQRRRQGYVKSINDLADAQAKLAVLQSDPTSQASETAAQQALVNQLAAQNAAWHTYHPGDVPEHNVGAGFRDVAIPGQMGDLTALGNPKDWPVAVSVQTLDTPKLNYYHAHRNIGKDFLTAETAAPDVIGGRLPIELTPEDGHWRVRLNDGTVLDVRSHKQISLVIDSGPVWKGGLSMLRMDGGLGHTPAWRPHTDPLAVKVGPFALLASVGGGLPSVDLQYNPVLRRDFYTYEHVGAQTLDIKVLEDPHNRFPDKWQIKTPSQGTVLSGVEKTLQFYTKWGVQGIVVPMVQIAVGDPAHGVQSLVPFLQVGGVGLAQITGEVVNISDAVTLRPLRTEWSVSGEWLFGDFISLPSSIGGVRTHQDVSWLLGWDPSPGTVMTNYVKGVDLTPFVKDYGAKILSRTPWIGDVIRRRALERRQAEADQLAAAHQHDDEVRRHLRTLKLPGA